MPIGQTSKGRTGSGTSVGTTGVNTSSGSTFVVLLAFNNSTTFTSIADTINGSASGNTWTQIGTEPSISGGKFRAYYCQNGNGGTNHVVTVTVGAATAITALMVEVTGVVTTSVTDGTSAFTLDSSSPFTSANVTTANANDVLVAGVMGDSGSNPATHAISSASPSSGWTIQTSTEETNGASFWVGCMATQTVSATGTYNGGFTESGATNGNVLLVALKLSSAAADQPPSQIYWPDSLEGYEAPDVYDLAPFDFYTDNGANNADVHPPPAPELPVSFEWEDVNTADDALWQWPLSQAPPIDDNDVAVSRVIDSDEQLEDVEEDFGFSFDGLDTPVADLIQGEDSDAQLEDVDEPFGFTADPLPDDNDVAASRVYDASEQFEEPDEDFGFTFDGVGADAVDDPITAELPVPEDDELVEGFADAPLPADAVDEIAPFCCFLIPEDEPEDFGFTSDAVSDPDEIAPFCCFLIPEDEEQVDGFADAPLPDDVQSDQVFVEDATQQPTDPEDEDFGFGAGPSFDDVIDSDQVFVECSDAQPNEPEDDEAFGFSDAPLPDDVAAPPPPPEVFESIGSYGTVGLGPFAPRRYAHRDPYAFSARPVVEEIPAAPAVEPAELPDVVAPIRHALRDRMAVAATPVARRVIPLLRSTPPLLRSQ